MRRTRGTVRSGGAGALAVFAVLALGACGGAAEPETSASASVPGATATAVQPSATPSEEATPTPDQEPDASADPTDPETPAAPQPVPPGPAGAVTGDPTVVDWSFHLPTGGVDACQFMDGVVACFFEEQTLDASCTGETPMARVDFDGTGLHTSCSPIGEAGLAPSPGVGQVVADPDGRYRCEIVGGPVGVRCTSNASGTTAVLTGSGVRLG